jgi:hypothetical protein
VAPSSTLERITKPVLLLSLCAAMWAATWGVSVTMPALRTMVPLAFAVAWPAALWRPRVVRAALLGICYVVPALFAAAGLPFSAGHWIVWLAPLAGVVVATTSWHAWTMPAPVKLSLAAWGLVVAMTWPIVVLREADFIWARVHPATASWAGFTAAAVIVGILWVDSLFATFPAAGESVTEYERQIVMPLAAGWLVAAAVGVYQMFVDVSFLNRSLWGALHRARGTLSDANPFGVISAIWGPLIFAVAIERWSGWRRIAGVAALPFSWLAVWSSGSRSSLPIAVLGFAFAAIWYVAADRTRRLHRLALAAALVAIIGAAGALATRWSGVHSPVARVSAMLAPQMSLAWIVQTTDILRARDGYGTLSEAVIREVPFVGVGVSAFHILVPTYALKLFRRYLPPDNAQNWFRHEVAELGLLGSLGAMVFAGWLLWQLARSRANSTRPFTSGALRTVLIGFGLISLVAVPAQDVAVTFTFWTIALWFVVTLQPRQPDSAQPANRRWWWIAVWFVALSHTVATLAVGRRDLRPPMRAAAADLDYSYGFYPPEPGATIRWASKRAVDVIPVPPDRRWLQVSVLVQHVDLPKNPVDVRVTANGDTIIDTQLTTIEPVTRYFRVPDGDKRVVVETCVSRTLRPRDFGVPDDRELGLLVDTKFVDVPPPGIVP